MFFCEFFEVSTNIFFTEHLWATASVHLKREYIEQQANDVYFIKKIKGQQGQKEIFIKWQKKRNLGQRCFPVNFAKFLRTPFLQNTSERLLLQLVERDAQTFLVTCANS